MKKIFMIVAFASATVFSACNNKAKQAEEARLQSIETQKAVARVKDSLRLDSFERAEAAALQAKRDREVAAAAVASQRVSSSRTSGGVSNNSAYAGTTQAQKKGWSDAAKGATIGGLAGAVGGAIIDKKKGRGAVVGGLLGAGTGYVIGHEKDKKTGRAN